MRRPLVVDGVPDVPTVASVMAAIDACNAERDRANALAPDLHLPHVPYPAALALERNVVRASELTTR